MMRFIVRIRSLKTKIKEVDQELRDAPKHDYVSGYVHPFSLKGN